MITLKQMIDLATWTHLASLPCEMVIMVLHNEPYYTSDLWWILYKVFYNETPKGTYKKEYFYNVSCAFDIETTSTYINGEKRAFMYVWMLGLGGYCIIGRTWDEFVSCLKTVSEYCGLDEKTFLPIYVHNLAYEFQFIKDIFKWERIFAIDTRKVNYCRTDFGIEFRCSYQLSGYSLAKLGEQLNKYKVKKLVGNLDYDLLRHSETPLTKEELQYCINDVLVVMAYVQECMETEGLISDIPLTKTGYVRRYVKRKCLGTSKNKNYAYRKFIHRLTLDSEEYMQLRRAFQGGFTHASPMHSNVTISDVDSYDFTSSYPAVMLSERFPMSKSKKIDIKSKEQFEDCIKSYCCLFDVAFTNIQSVELFDDYLSKSHCRDIANAEVNNGRIVSAEYLVTTITEQDYMIIKRMYKWDKMQVGNFRIYHKQYLPKPFIDAILTLYEDKTQLKDVAGKEVEYQHAKANLNSLYGMTVTDIVRDDIYYDGEWFTEAKNLDDSIEKYNSSSTRFMFYPWGVWVTAYARANLWTGIVSCGNDYVYSDTDSLKMLNGDSHKDYIEKYNEMINAKIARAMDYIGFSVERTRPKTIKGIEKPIGVWDYEGHYQTFKTLGAKRYLWLDDSKRMQMTVAGLHKKIGLKYLQFKANESGSVFDMFTDGMYIPSGWTGKMIHTYIDSPTSGYVRDYLGNTSFFSEKSSIHMEPTDYSLSIGYEYANFLIGIRERLNEYG